MLLLAISLFYGASDTKLNSSQWKMSQSPNCIELLITAESVNMWLTVWVSLTEVLDLCCHTDMQPGIWRVSLIAIFSLIGTKQKKNQRVLFCEGLESINGDRLLANHNPWLVGLYCRAKLHIKHTEKKMPGILWTNQMLANCSVCDDWVHIVLFLPLHAWFSMCSSLLLGLCRIKMMIFLYVPHMFLDKSKDQADNVYYGEEKNACRLFRSHGWKPISVWYIWAQPLKS